MKLFAANIFPRPRASSADANSQERILAGEFPSIDLDLQQGVNRALLSGVMVDEPQRERSRGCGSITVLLLSFASPDERAGSASGLCEVEVVDEIADRYRSELRHGARVLVVGEMTGSGALWANFLAAEAPK